MISTLGDVAIYLNGYPFKTTDWGEKGYPIIRIQNLTESTKEYNYFSGEIDDKYFVDEGDILIPWSGSIFASVWKGPKALLNQHIYKVKLDEKIIDKKFFLQQVNYVLKKATDLAHGATMKHLTKNVFQSIQISLPTLTEQRNIGNILGGIDGIIDNLKLQLGNLDLMVKSRFIELFGDPVNNEKRWKTCGLLDLGKCKNGMNFRSSDTGIEINCLGVGDFKTNSYIKGTSLLPKISINEFPSEEYLLKDGDIVFVRSNGNKKLVGRSICVFPNHNPTTFSGFCIRFRLESDQILPVYLLQVLKAKTIREKLTGRGANIQNLN